MAADGPLESVGVPVGDPVGEPLVLAYERGDALGRVPIVTAVMRHCRTPSVA